MFVVLEWNNLKCNGDAVSRKEVEGFSPIANYQCIFIVVYCLTCFHSFGFPLSQDSPNDSINNNISKSSRTEGRLGTKKVPALSDKVEWPIVILRGNGNIYVLCAGIDTSK